MKKIYLLYYLFIYVSLNEPLRAQDIQRGSNIITIPVEKASRHIGNIVKLNYGVYKTADNGKTLLIYMNTKRPDKSLMLILNGESRKKILDELHIRRKLNIQIKSPLDTSITATGKIIFNNDRLSMLVSQASNVYVGVDLKIQRP